MPVYVDCEQGSNEWVSARLGIPTATGFKRIVTPKGALSASREKYMAELVAEWCRKEPFHDFQSEEMQRGKDLEPEAFKVYGMMRDVDPETVGFIYKDESKLVGCSPDGLVGDDGLLELKCPMLSTHLLYLAQGELPKEYFAQCQGQIWITGRAWVDMMSYFPGYPHFMIRTLPDPDFQRALDKNIHIFCSELVALRQRLVDMGVPVEEHYEYKDEREPGYNPFGYDTQYMNVP